MNASTRLTKPDISCKGSRQEIHLSAITGLTKGGSIPKSQSAAFDCSDPLKNASSTEEEQSSGGWPLRQLPAHSLRFPLWKRSLDLGLVTLTLPVWGILMILITVWIKISSKGPVFFSQTRVGLGGRPFIIRKFRSMHPRAETTCHENHFRAIAKSNAALRKLDELNDNRIIPGGKLIRALALDELPQLLNVILGEMSLVGPRPCTVKEYFLFEGGLKARFQAPPGLTGYWQVSGKNRTTFRQMVSLDISYAERMSPLLDLTIILATVPALLLQAIEYSWRQQPPAKSESMPVGLPGHATQPIT